MESTLKSYVREHDLSEHVIFLGYRLDAQRIVSGFDIFCLTSNSEGMSNAVMEASAVACPVVSTRVGGVPEIVVDGKTGFHIKIGDEDALVEKLDLLLKDAQLRSRLGTAGRDHISDQFSIAGMVAAHQALYTSMMEK